MKSKLIILMIAVVFISSLAMVSAEDVNDTDEITSVDDSLNEEIVTTEINEESSVVESTSEDVLTSDDATTEENPRYGIVDFGSNTIKMEIYEVKKSGKISSIFSLSEKSVTSRYVENDNLTDTGISELVSILKDYNNVMDMVGVKEKYVFATASLRKVNNSAEVIEIVKQKTGLEIHLLAGETEAKTSFSSVKDTELTVDDGIAIDLGGGSCEVIDFINKTRISSESMPIGADSLYKDYVSSIFPNDSETKSIKNRVLEELKKLKVTNDTDRSDLFVIGGTGKTMRKVMALIGLIGSKDYAFETSKLDEFLDSLKEPTQENINKILTVNAERINTLLPGAIAIKTVAEYFNVSTVHVCKNGIREGILMEILKNESETKIIEATTITSADVKSAYNENKYIIATLKDSTGNPLSGVKVSVVINGKTQTPTTDANGQVKISANGLAPKSYPVSITFNGNDDFEKSTKTVKLTVVKATPKMTAKKKTFKVKTKVKKYSITLKVNNKVMKNKKVTLKVKGKTYSAKTNTKGKATFKITKLNKKGSFDAVVKYKGSTCYNKVSKKVKIKVKK